MCRDKPGDAADPTCHDQRMTSLSNRPTSHADALRTRVRGRVMIPSDEGYAESTKLFNGMIDNRPDVVVQAYDADDVASAIRFAREQELDLSIRGGGHGVLGEATAGQLVIDLSAMGSVSIDPAARTAKVHGGAVWSSVDGAAQEHGLAVPGGRVTHTGVAGLTLGGGQGWLSSKHGLTIDNLLSVDLVTADGRQVTASAANEPELFWALRGGGGGFGAVTSFTFQLHPVGPMIIGGMLVFPADRASEVCSAYSDFAGTAPDDFGGAAVFLSAPAAPFVPPEAVGAPIVALVAAWFGDHDAGEKAIQPLRDLGPMIDMVGPMPYVALQGLIDEGNPFGLRHYWTAEYVARLSPALLADTVELAIARPSPLSNVIIAPMGNAVHRVGEEETAFGHREAGWLYHPLAMWTDPADDETNRAWARSLGAAVKPHATGGTYLNVDGESGSAERMRSAFGDATYRRLAAVKRTWDPDNVFRHAMPIPTR